MTDRLRHLQQIAAACAEAGSEAVDIYGPLAEDYFIRYALIATALNERHIRGLIRTTKSTLHAMRLRPLNTVSHRDASGWVIIDCGDAVIHLILADLRAAYNLNAWYASLQSQ